MSEKRISRYPKNDEISLTMKVGILKLVSQLSLSLPSWKRVSEFQSHPWGYCPQGIKKWPKRLSKNSSYTVRGRKLKLSAVVTLEKLSVPKISEFWFLSLGWGHAQLLDIWVYANTCSDPNPYTIYILNRHKKSSHMGTPGGWGGSVQRDWVV